MLSIILTGHGGFASGMEKAMKQILGEQSQFIAIDFPETSSTALLTSQLEEAIAQLDCFSDGFAGRHAVSRSFNAGDAKTGL